MYFLLVALSQAIPALQIGYLSTYIVPLACVLAITLGKEAWDDIERRKRDKEANSEGYTVLIFDRPGMGDVERYRARRKLKSKASKSKRLSVVEPDRLSDIQEEEENAHSEGRMPSSIVREVIKKARYLKVGDVLKLGKDQRLPADVVILKSYPSETASTTSPIPSIDPVLNSFLVDPISDPPIEESSSTLADTRESTSELDAPDASPS